MGKKAQQGRQLVVVGALRRTPTTYAGEQADDCFATQSAEGSAIASATPRSSWALSPAAPPGAGEL